jgi:hypothetical protein
MASYHFIPTRDADLVTWSLNFKTRIATMATSVGLTSAQSTAYGLLHDSFVTAFNDASSDATNSRSAIITKNEARASLVANARLLAGIAQKFPGTTNTQRSELGLTVKDADPSPIPPPAMAPGLLILSVSGTTARVRLTDPANPTRRGKPAGVAGASIFSYVGATPPAALSDWRFEGNTTRTGVEVAFPADTAPGARAWLAAFWYNPRAQRGPACTAVGTNLPGGAVSGAAAEAA